MREEITDYTEAQLRDIFLRAGLNSDEVERAIKDYIRYRESELSSLSILTYQDLQTLGAENIAKEIFNRSRNGEDIIGDILRGYSSYISSKRGIAKTYQDSNSWDKVITTVVYVDDPGSQEAFIDYIEEIYQTRVKDAKQLQKITGITKETLEGLEQTLINSRYSKYFRSLERAIDEGATYKDLLNIKPEDYGLGKTWRYCLGKDQYSSILYAIYFQFLLNEPAGTTLTANLRAVANELEAPYSVVMDSYKLNKPL